MTQHGPPGADDIFGRRGAPPKAKTEPPPTEPAASTIEPKNPTAPPAQLTANIVYVFPDVTQPRRAVPTAARIHWNGKPDGTISLFEGWIAEASAESGQPIDVLKETYKRIIDQDPTEMPDEQVKPIERALLRVVRLAASVANDGLEYPIIVTPRADDTYQIGDGERRWLAFHLLYYFTEDQQWLFIPIKVDDKFDRFDQATSNLNREDLNMVARARQYSLLMMELLPAKHRFTPYDYFANDRDFYAQVIDLDAPDGTIQRLLNACGVSNRASLSVYRQVLQLPQEQWQIADEQDLGIRQIRSLLNALNNAKKSSNPPPKTPAKTDEIREHFGEMQKHFRSSLKNPNNKATLRKELGKIEEWVKAMRADLDES